MFDPAPRPTGGCSRLTLAETPTCLIQQCSCGHVHLAVGPVTLRLEPEAIAELSRALEIAARALGPVQRGLN